MTGPLGDDGGLAAFLRRRQAAILDAWRERVRRLPPARELTEAELLDHMPQLLDRIVSMVEDLEAGRPIGSAGSLAEEHALERLDEGYDLEQVVREFVTLRQCMLDLWAGQPQHSPATPILNRAIDEALLVAVSRYGAARERTLVALDRISAATLRAVDLDQLLTSLTDVLLETTPAIDSVAVYLRHGDRLRLHAAVGVEASGAGRATVEVDRRTCAGHIAATGEPLELREAATSPLCSPALRDAGARAFYGVPMHHDGEIVGVAHVSSGSAFEFSRQDKLVFRSMVERATTAIVQRQLQDSLAGERRRLAAVVDTLPVAVWVADRTGRVVRTNRAADEMWGGAVPTPSGVDGYAAYRAWHADGRPMEAHEWGLARAVERGESTEAEEIVFERFDGKRGVMLLSGRPIRDEQGGITGGVTVNMDITARKAAEDARREMERRFHLLADNIAQLVWMSDPAGERFWFNRRWYEYTGTTPGEMMGSAWRRVHHPDHVERAAAGYLAHLRSGEPWEDTFPLRGRDGNYRWFLTRAIPVRDGGGRITQWFGTNTDVTGSKLAEEERRAALDREKRARATAENAAATLDAVFAAVPVGLAFLDLDGRYVRINDSLAVVNGRPPAEHVGRYVHEVLPEGGAALEEMLRSIARTGRPVLGYEVALAPPSTPDRVREWQVNMVPIRLPDGRTIGIGAATVEITELKQALRARDEFLGMASHELKSPLTGLGLQLDAMDRRLGRDGGPVDRVRVTEHVANLRRLLHRLGALLDDLLDVSRIDSGELSLEVAELDLAEFLREVAGRHAELLAKAGCDLDVDIEGRLVGSWDGLRVDQVLTNLLTNAAKYAPGHPVHVTLRADEDRAELTVRDEGPGISASDQARVFQRFERAARVKSVQGTGLGLWIVRKIVEAMGGRIRLESEVGRGCTFVVTLPLRPGTGSEVPEAREPRPGPGEAPGAW